MSTTTIIETLEGLFKAGAKPTEDDFKKLINTYLVNDNNKVGIGTTEPKNNLDIKGKAVIGTAFAGKETAPSNGLIVEGNVGIGHEFADEALHVKGSLKLEEGGLIIGGQQVINEAGVWQGKLPDQDGGDEEQGSAHWSDGDDKVTTTVKVGIGQANPTADLHVNGNVQIDQGQLKVDGLLTKKQVAFTAQGYNKEMSDTNGHITFQTVLDQAQPSPFSFFNNSVFQPDAAHAGLYFITVSLTITEKEDTQVPGDDDKEDPAVTDPDPLDAQISLHINGENDPLLVVRPPGSCSHASASIVHSFDGNTGLTLQSDVPGINLDQIILTAYRL